MEKLYCVATGISFVLNISRVYIFCNPNVCPEVSLSSIIFLASVFMVLYQITKGYYVREDMKIFRAASAFLQFLFATYIMEHAMTRFWCPLGVTIQVFLSYLAFVWKYFQFPEYMTCDIAHAIFSYSFSVFCFHFVFLKRGPGTVLHDIPIRMQTFLKIYYQNSPLYGSGDSIRS